VTDQLVQAGRQLASELGDHRIGGEGAMQASAPALTRLFDYGGKSVLKERLLWGSAAAACGEPAEETYEEVDHAENDEAGEDDIIAGTAAVCLGLGIRVGDRGDDDAYDSHERAAYH